MRQRWISVVVCLCLCLAPVSAHAQSDDDGLSMKEAATPPALSSAASALALVWALGSWERDNAAWLWFGSLGLAGFSQGVAYWTASEVEAGLEDDAEVMVNVFWVVNSVLVASAIAAVLLMPSPDDNRSTAALDVTDGHISLAVPQVAASHNAVVLPALLGARW